MEHLPCSPPRLNLTPGPRQLTYRWRYFCAQETYPRGAAFSAFLRPRSSGFVAGSASQNGSGGVVR
jgi:hypothetical protein